MTTPLPKLISLLLSGAAAVSISACASTSSLDEQFGTPPQSAKPLVWWHWMNGNVTKDGIHKDLDWMSRMGIGGVQNFDAELMTPQIVDKRVVYMTDDWADHFRYALSEADSHNFEFSIAASPGWSETGGPWVEPKDGMKKLVWSETTVSSIATPPYTLVTPPHNTGLFQNYSAGEKMFGSDKAEAHHGPSFYGDIRVIAIPSTGKDKLDVVGVSASYGDTPDLNAMFDGDYNTAGKSISQPGNPLAMTFDLGAVQSVASASVALPPPGMFLPAQFSPALQASADGTSFTDVAEFPASNSLQTTVSFAPVQARYLRLVMAPNKNGGFSMPSSVAPGAKPPGNFSLPTGEPAPADVSLLEVAFYNQPRVHHFEDKAGYNIVEDYYPLSYQKAASGVATSQVIDVTQYLNEDGTLNWQPPAGEWRIIRLGYTLTGKENHPATPEATGLEVDKYDDDAVSRYINHYLDNYVRQAGKDQLGEQGINALLNDSIEVGASNWTPAMFDEFKQRRGYDLTPWLPALTGVIVGNAKQTDQFLYDYRQTLAELLADNHYAVITRELHKRGMKHYSEALENGRPALGDGMRMRRTADIPMAAMWAFDTKNNVGPAPQYWADIREAASVAHLYGQNLVAAESLTSASSPWAFSPRDLQPMIDMEFALGVNRPIIHTSVHQPLDEAPGLSLFVFGQYFNRLDTWADYAKPWVTYISRNAFMLQQGRFVADVAYFYGEETPLTALYNDKPSTDVPANNAFDYVNSDVIKDLLSVKNGELVSTSGQRYKALYLGGTSQFMTLPVLQKLAALVRSGATVIGKQPVASPSLADDTDAFAMLATALWSGETGKGRIIVANDVTDGLKKAGVAEDFAFTSDHNDTTLMFVHRQTTDEDIYFYTNRKDRQEPVTLSFAISGKTPYHYDAASGTMTPVAYRTEKGKSVLTRTLKPYESGYIVFKKAKAEVPENKITTPALTLNSGWTVDFQANRGAPAGRVPLALGDWAQSEDEGIKYFSGTAVYHNQFTLEKVPAIGSALLLDLGEVRELAEVSVNGKVVDILWKPPYQVDIAPFVQAGNNQIDVAVTNLWVNRLIGDNQDNVEKTYTFTTLNTYFGHAPLRASGLMGPVTLSSQH